MPCVLLTLLVEGICSFAHSMNSLKHSFSEINLRTKRLWMTPLVPLYVLPQTVVHSDSLRVSDLTG